MFENFKQNEIIFITTALVGLLMLKAQPCIVLFNSNCIKRYLKYIIFFRKCYSINGNKQNHKYCASRAKMFRLFSATFF